MPVPAGSRLGRYEIRSLLGVGGMGEVYLSQDTQLRRSVALKILPPEFTRDEDRLRRFKQEAFAASALNHPNIFTIYEIGHEENLYFIATEYIDGLSLRQTINKNFLELDQILDWGSQIAAALAAAHAAGIVHRDIKPDNIMIRRDGFIKVLDFGLAKLSEYKGLPSDPEAATVQVVKTDPGKVMGTANYMSPEQTRGLELDQRTDLWSLGVIMYEMVAGRVPFEGTSPNDVIASILRTDPVPLQRYAPAVPDEFQRIVRKALQKDPDERYQLAKELALDLKNLRREIELNAEIERSVQPASGNVDISVQNSLTNLPTLRPPSTGGSGPVRSTASIASDTSVLTRRSFVLGVLAFLALGLGSVGIYRWFTRKSSQPRLNMRITRLTTTGTAYSAAISPDGKYIVHVASESGQQSLRVRQVNTNSDVQIMPPSNLHYADLTFAPDGDFIYYIAREQNGSSSNLYVIPALGGNARKLISNVTGSVSLSSDGEQLAFIRNLPDVGEDAVFIADTSGGAERKIAARKLPNFFRSLCWSPDKTRLIAGAGSFVPTYNSYLVELPLNGGNEKQFSQQTWLFIGDIAWVSDRTGLVFDASDHESTSVDSKQLWFVSYPEGEANRITNDLNNYDGVSVTSDSRRLVTLQSETTGNIWLANTSDQGPTQLTIGSGRVDGHGGVAWTADGQIVYSSQASGQMDLWIMKADGSNQRQITSNSRNNHHPAVTPDGRYIVFTSDRRGTPNIWRVDIDGSNPKQLTSGSGETNPNCMPDGKGVVYTLLGAGKPTVWRVSIDGGAPQQLINDYATTPATSPDGKSIACLYREDQQNSRVKLAIFPIEGGHPLRTFEVAGLPGDSSTWPPINWSSDSRAISYVVTSGGISNIWSQPITGEPAKQLTNYKSDRIFAFAWSRDGKQLMYSRGTVSSDVVLISNFE